GAEHASAWVAVWGKKARSRLAPPIVISRAAWVIATPMSIWVRPLSWQRARWLDLFAHQRRSQNALRARLFDGRKGNRRRPGRWRSLPVFRQAYTVGFFSLIRTI